MSTPTPSPTATLTSTTSTLTSTATTSDGSDVPQSTINIDASYLFDWSNAAGLGPFFTSNSIDGVQQITTAALMGSACLVVFSVLRYRWPELYSHRLRLRRMRPPTIPRTVFGWMYPVVTMSDRHVLETMGLDAVLFFRAYRMFIYMFITLSAFGMLVLYPVNFRWGREEGADVHTIFDSPLGGIRAPTGRYLVPHALMAYVFAAVVFFYMDRFALHTVTMRWHYLLLTRRAGNARTLMVTRLPAELRSEPALARFVRGMGVGAVESVHVAPASAELTDALAHRARVLERLEAAYVAVLGNPCRARSYDPALLRRVVLTDTPEARALERQLLERWGKRQKPISQESISQKPISQKPISRPRVLVPSDSGAPWWSWRAWRAGWPLRRVDAIDHWRAELAAADARLQRARAGFGRGAGSSTAFVTMTRPEDAHALAQLSVHARPSAFHVRMAPEARSVVWRSVGRPLSAKMLRYLAGLAMTAALLLLWCVPVIAISTLISLRFLVTRSPHLADVVRNSRFVRSLLGYTLPSLILTIFLTILPRLLWSFVLAGGDRSFAVADKNMFIRHWYFLVLYIVVVFGMSGTVWSSIYDMFTHFGSFWQQLVTSLPQLATWYSVYVLLYGAGYQVMKLLHLKSLCRFLFHQARARTPRQYMKAISPVFIDWGTFQPYMVLFFAIGILFAHLQPLLLPMCLLYFVIGLLVMKYMCVYAWYFRQQTAGAIWPVIFRRMAACVLLYQAMTTAIFARGDDSRWFIGPMAVLMVCSWYYYWVRCKSLRRMAESVPLQLLREADRRRRLALAQEAKQQQHATVAAAGAADSCRASVDHHDGPPAIRVDPGDSADPAAAHPKPEAATTPETQSLVPQRRRPRRTRAMLRSAVVHPARAVVGAVSRAIVWLQGDPAAPLLEFLDDYAFPERVDRVARPAGRSAADPRLAKEQPGSLLDVARSVVLGIPRAFAAMGTEFFGAFHVPRALLDTSAASYPRAENAESAFVTAHHRKRGRKRSRSRVAAVSGDYYHYYGDDDDGGGGASSSNNSNDGSNNGDSARQMHFCLAPAARPPADVPSIAAGPQAAAPPRIVRTSTVAPAVGADGAPAAMQYQALSSEQPFGTQTNRKRTDFAQANMSYLPGVLDSTRFTYQHPGLLGDLPSLWLPVQCLKRRSELHRTMRERLRSAAAAVESALEENIIGERAARRLSATRREVRRRVRDAAHLSPFASRQPAASSASASASAAASASASASADHPGSIDDATTPLSPPDAASTVDSASVADAPAAVQSKMDDMLVESRCCDLGINPDIVRRWDPLRLHRTPTAVAPVDLADMAALDDSASEVDDNVPDPRHEEEAHQG